MSKRNEARYYVGRAGTYPCRETQYYTSKRAGLLALRAAAKGSAAGCRERYGTAVVIARGPEVRVIQQRRQSYHMWDTLYLCKV